MPDLRDECDAYFEGAEGALIIAPDGLDGAIASDGADIADDGAAIDEPDGAVASDGAGAAIGAGVGAGAGAGVSSVLLQAVRERASNEATSRVLFMIPSFLGGGG